ncbi:hypothetical protein XM47_15780 [Catenovulum maritimum]|uniref:Periplasmic binding protein domain-containing protein n=2 Tax=Catenovulum maritimum TaxID=1513271 RepID=A0A0J8GMX4_9ALTE|nr:hypothetical protein XM47_15780 [Catenovulum maritimum]
MYSLCKALIVIILPFTSLFALAEKVKVAYFIPAAESQVFWDSTIPIAKESAKQFEIDLSIILAGYDRFNYIENVNKAVNLTQFDYAIVRPLGGNTKKLFDLLESKNIRYISFEAEPKELGLNSLESIRKSYPNWRQNIYYDNIEASESITQYAINRAKKLDVNCNIIALSGSWDNVTQARELGLKNIVNLDPECEIKSLAKTHWEVSRTEQQLSLNSLKQAETSIYWTAGSELAIAVTNKVMIDEEKTVLVTFDFITDALELVENKKIAASIGGHFIFPYLAMIQINQDLIKKDSMDFREDKIKLGLVDLKNVGVVLQKLKASQWDKIDLVSYSQYLRQTNNNATFDALKLINKLPLN